MPVDNEDLSNHELFTHVEEQEKKGWLSSAQELFRVVQKFEVDAYKWCEEKSRIVPDFIPVLAPLIQCGLSTFRENLASQGIKADTGEKIEGGLKERVIEVLKIKLEGLYHQLELAIDTIAIVGTAGAGAPAEIGAKELLKRVAKEWFKQTGKKVATHVLTGQGGEPTGGEEENEQTERYADSLGNPDLKKLAEVAKSMGDPGNEKAPLEVLQLLGQASQRSGEIAADKLNQPALAEIGRQVAAVLGKLTDNPTISKFMQETLKNFSGWKDMQAKLARLGQVADALSKGLKLDQQPVAV